MISKIACFMVFIMIAFLVGCGYDPSLPVYEMTRNEEEGIVVFIGGVKYQSLPYVLWQANYDRKTIGYAGPDHIPVLGALNDPDRNFIFLISKPGWDTSLEVLHKAGIPKASADTVTEISYSESFIRDNKEIKNIIKDKLVIKALFDALEAGEKKQMLDLKAFDAVSVDLYCTSDAVPGASYSFGVLRDGDKIMCGNASKGYAEISVQLLEKIAGHQIDMESWLGD